MKTRWLWIACASAAAGCGRSETPKKTQPTSPPVLEEAPVAVAPKLTAPVREGGALVRSAADDALYVAGEDHATVRVLALPLDLTTPVREVAMPGQPAQVLALGDSVLVTIRSAGGFAPGDPKAPKADRPNTLASATGPGLLLIMKPDAEKGLVETARVELPRDAWGVGVSEDEATAVVTSAWTHQVSVIDLASRKVRATLNVPREPRGVVVTANGSRAYVTHLVGADLTRIDGLDGEPRAHPVHLAASPVRTPVGKRTDASLAYAAVLSPDEKRLFVARHAIGAVGPQVWFGASAIDVMLTADDSPAAPLRSDSSRLLAPGGDVVNAAAQLNDLESGGTAPRTDPVPFAQPRAMIYRKRDKKLLVVSESHNTVAELDARAFDPVLHGASLHSLEHCQAPTGIALSKDEQTEWVYCRASNTLVVDSFGWKGPRPFVKLADDLLSEKAARGRALFYDGGDDVMSGGLGCAGCHPEGRDDGHVWHESTVMSPHPTFLGGGDNATADDDEHLGYARQTPMLAGRVIAEGPYGWHAESGTISDRIRGGFKLHRWTDHWPDVPSESYERAMAIRAFLREGLVPPPKRGGDLTAVEERGKKVFESNETGCVACHVPASDFSDREAYPVFSALPPPKGFADDPEKKFKTPSLRFVGGTAPYGHDGRFPTLRALIDLNEDRMGHTNQLGAADREALVAYLETL